VLRPRVWLSPGLRHRSIQNCGVQSPDVSRPMAWPKAPRGSSLLFGERGLTHQLCEGAGRGPAMLGADVLQLLPPGLCPGPV